MKYVSKQQDLQMFGLKLNKYQSFSPTWAAEVLGRGIAKHTLKSEVDEHLGKIT